MSEVLHGGRGGAILGKSNSGYCCFHLDDADDCIPLLPSLLFGTSAVGCCARFHLHYYVIVICFSQQFQFFYYQEKPQSSCFVSS